MRRLVPAFLSLLLLCPASFGQDPAKPAATGDLGVEQQILARKFQEFEKALMQLTHRLERSAKPEDRERAANIKKAIAYSADKDVKGKFETLIKSLQGSKDLSIPEIQSAMKNTGMVADDVRAIIQLLMADPRDEELKKEKKKIEDVLKALEDVIRKQKVVRAQTEAGKSEKGQLTGDQKKVTERTADIGKAMDQQKADKEKGEPKKGDDSKDAKGEPKEGGDPKDGKGEPKKGDDSKDAKGEPKKGGEPKDGKGEPKPGEDSKDAKGEPKKGGDPKDGQSGGQGQPNDGQQPPKPNPNGEKPMSESTPGRKQIQDANDYQKKAENNLEENDRNEASKNQDKALKELEEARKKLEEILRQLREEELERLLAALEARCQKMLQMQIEVRDGTVRLAKAVEATEDKKATRSDEQKSLQLSDREQQIVDEATKAMQLLEAEGSAVAFYEQFLQVREDMRHVVRRLGKADVGAVTQTIEEDIIAVLKEMIDALKKAQKQMQENRSNPQQNQQNPGQNQKLLDMIAELKMVRSMQLRVNSRTKLYGEKYQGEQAVEPDILKELGDLAARQQKIYDVTDNIYKGKNK